jgi:hypothetical protein
LPISGTRKFVKVSGHNKTLPRATSSVVVPGALPVLLRVANQVSKLCSANCGISRCWAIPPIRFTSLRLAKALASFGARAASRDHSGSHPIDQCDNGLAHGRRA